MARKIIVFILGYFVWVGLLVFVGMDYLNKALIGKSSPFGIVSGLPVMIIGSMILFGAPIIIFLIFFFRTPKWEKDLQVNGTSAQADVLEVTNTGVYTGSRYNGTPWLRVKLRVRPSGDAPFEYTLEKSADKLMGVYEGATVNVKYDPDNKKHVVLVKPEGQFVKGVGFNGFSGRPTVINMQSGNIPPQYADLINNALNQAGQQGKVVVNGQGASGNLTAQLTELATLHQNGALSDAEYEAAKKKILSSL
jgi:hypothetical protein